MRSVFLVAGLLVAISAFAGDASRRTYQFGGLTLGELLKEDIAYGCGCSFHYPPSSKAESNPLIQWELGESASMHIDGRLEILTPDEGCFSTGELGKPESCHFQGRSVTADISATTTWTCPADNESCEVTEYTGTLRVSKGSLRASVPVWGACGC